MPNRPAIGGVAGPTMIARRLWALSALLCAALAAGVGVALAIEGFPRGLSVFLLVAASALAAWYGVRRRGRLRAAALSLAALLIAGAVAVVFLEGRPVLGAIIVVLLALASRSASNAFRVHVELPNVSPPRNPVLFYNPLSGGGKADRFHLAEQARLRGIEPVELRAGTDLGELVRDAVSRGADGLAMAGGDGSQAIVADIASQLDLPYACIPAGTRNHFALDLGVDRDDVVGALDAFVDGGERRVDLAEVNGRVFVNNVSLGLYAEAVQRPEYRDAKLRTLAATVPDALGPEGPPSDLHWTGPDGRQSGAAILVSNNPYRLGRMVGSATRPRLDRGVLGIVVAGPVARRRGRSGGRPQLRRGWSERSFEIAASAPVPAGIDGEAVVLDPPLRFGIRAGALRVRIAHQHMGASPSALEPDSPWTALAALCRFAFQRQATPV
jgi:diacylglycerol kinase family enzyme